LTLETKGPPNPGDSGPGGPVPRDVFFFPFALNIQVKIFSGGGGKNFFVPRPRNFNWPGPGGTQCCGGRRQQLSAGVAATANFLVTFFAKPMGQRGVFRGPPGKTPGQGYGGLSIKKRFRPQKTIFHKKRGPGGEGPVWGGLTPPGGGQTTKRACIRKKRGGPRDILEGLFETKTPTHRQISGMEFFPQTPGRTDSKRGAGGAKTPKFCFGGPHPPRAPKIFFVEKTFVFSTPKRTRRIPVTHGRQLKVFFFSPQMGG